MFKHISLIVLVITLMLVAPIFDAQPAHSAPGATPKATLAATAQAAAVATTEATAPAIVVVVAPGATQPDPVPPTADGTMSIWVTLILIVITAITSGLAGGIGAARMLVSGLEKVNQNPALIQTMETAIDGLRTSVLAVDLLRAVALGAEIAGKITDGIPESAKTPSANEGPLGGARTTLQQEAAERAAAMRTLPPDTRFDPPPPSVTEPAG